MQQVRSEWKGAYYSVVRAVQNNSKNDVVLYCSHFRRISPCIFILPKTLLQLLKHNRLSSPGSFHIFFIEFQLFTWNLNSCLRANALKCIFANGFFCQSGCLNRYFGKLFTSLKCVRIDFCNVFPDYHFF